MFWTLGEDARGAKSIFECALPCLPVFECGVGLN